MVPRAAVIPRAQRRWWSEPGLFVQTVKMKRQISREASGLLHPSGLCWCAGVSRGHTVWQSWRGDPHTASLFCALLRQVGRWAACQGSWLGNGYLWATGKVSHLRITHSQRRCGKKERRQKGRVAVLSCSLDHGGRGSDVAVEQRRKTVTCLWCSGMLWLTRPSNWCCCINTCAVTHRSLSGDRSSAGLSIKPAPWVTLGF